MSETRTFQPGDVCIVKDWDEMEEEFGLTSWGSIDSRGACFPEEMRYLCGKIITIQKVDEGKFQKITTVERVEFQNDERMHWTIVASMVKHYEEEVDSEYKYSEEDIINILKT